MSLFQSTMSANFQTFQEVSLALQQITLDHNVQQAISILSTCMCFASIIYVIILHIFRSIFFENDSLSQSLLQVSLCALVIMSNYLTVFLPERMALLAQLTTAIESLYFANRLHRIYISGVKYKPNDVEGKVFVITGASSGKPTCIILLF
jgi:hypothetical protein